MTMAILPAVPERETKAAPAARGQDRAALSDAFGRQIQRTEKEAARPSNTAGAEPEAGETVPEGRQADAKASDPKGTQLAREVLDLLSAAGRPGQERGAADAGAVPATDGSATLAVAPTAAAAEMVQTIAAAVSRLNPEVGAQVTARTGTPSGKAGAPILADEAARTDFEAAFRVPADEAALARAAGKIETADMPQGSEAQVAARAARLEIVRQETHFEPTMRDAVLVEETSAGEPRPAAPRERDLRQLLAERPEAAPAVPASSREKEPSSSDRIFPRAAVPRQAQTASPETLAPLGRAEPAAGSEDPLSAVRQSGDAILRGETDIEPLKASVVKAETDRSVPVLDAADSASPDSKRGAAPLGADRALAPFVSTPSLPQGTLPGVRQAVDDGPVRDTGVATRTEETAGPSSPPLDSFEPSTAPRAQGEAGRGRGESGGERPAFLRAPEASPVAPSVPASTGGANPVLPVTAQVAARIVDAFAGPLPADRPLGTSSAEAHLRLRAGGAALKTLTIQLQPEHLGTLHISMRLNEGQLMLEMVASRAETARMLTEDRASLKTLLEGAGFAIEDAAITVVARDMSIGQPPAQGGREQDGAAGRGFERSSDQGTTGEGREGRSHDEERRGAPAGDARAARSEPGRQGNHAGSVFL